MIIVDLFFMNELEILKLIWRDLTEPVSYIPLGLSAGAALAACSVLFDLIFRKNKKRQSCTEPVWLRALCCFFLGVYLIVLLEQGLFSRPRGSRSGVSMLILETWKGGAQSKAYVIENLLMFVPFGFLLPACVSRTRSLLSTVPLAFMFSVLLEYVQYRTQRGHAQADDVLMNTLGALCGFLIFLALKPFFDPEQPDLKHNDREADK